MRRVLEILHVLDERCEDIQMVISQATAGPTGWLIKIDSIQLHMVFTYQ
jgi:hypothetical protein